MMLHSITSMFGYTELTEQQLWLNQIVDKLSAKNISLTPAEIKILSMERIFFWHSHELIELINQLEEQGILSIQTVRVLIRSLTGGLFSTLTIGGIMPHEAVDALVDLSSELTKREIKLDDFLDSLLKRVFFSDIYLASLRHLAMSNLWTDEHLLKIEKHVKSGLIKNVDELGAAKDTIIELPDRENEDEWMYFKYNYATMCRFYEALNLYARLGILNQNTLNIILSLESPVQLYSFYDQLSTYSFIDEAMIKTTLQHPNLSGIMSFIDKYTVSKNVGLSVAQKYIIKQCGAQSFELNAPIFSYLIRKDFIWHSDPYAICALFILDSADLLTEKNYYFISKGSFSGADKNASSLKGGDFETNALILRHLKNREEYKSYPATLAPVKNISISEATTSFEGLTEMLGVYLCEQLAKTKEFGQKLDPLCYDLFHLHQSLSEAYTAFKSSHDYEQFHTSTKHLIGLHKKSMITAKTMVEWVQDFLEYLVDAIATLFRPKTNENHSTHPSTHSPRFFFAERPGQYVMRQLEVQSELLGAQNKHGGG